MHGRAASRALLHASEALHELVASDADAPALDAAMAARDSAFEAVRARAAEAPLPPPVRATLARVCEIDAAILARAAEARQRITSERETLANARRAGRSLRPARQAPRFVACKA